MKEQYIKKIYALSWLIVILVLAMFIKSFFIYVVEDVEIIDHFKLTNFFVRLIGLDNIYAAGKLDNGIKTLSSAYEIHALFL